MGRWKVGIDKKEALFNETYWFKKDVAKGNLQPIYLIEGPDNYIQNAAKKILTALIPEDQQVMNVGTYDLENTDLGLLLDDAQSSPFLGTIGWWLLIIRFF